jgi:2-phosphosulfolactate phosphatase
MTESLSRPDVSLPGSNSCLVQVDAVYLPKDLTPAQTNGRTLVVFDVLRATTSMTAALAAGVREIRIFDDIDTAADAARHFDGPRLLCGETNCLPPPGFDLGNSPAAFQREPHADRTAFLSTTNGTKAVIAARGAAVVLIGAVVNAAAVAKKIAEIGRDVTLLCAGTRGRPAMEDVIGAGAVIDALIAMRAGAPSTDAARMAVRLFRSVKTSLRAAMAEAEGGRYLFAVGLESDIDFCAALDSIPLVGVARDHPLGVTILLAAPAGSSVTR